jgi:hypothetical protein
MRLPTKPLALLSVLAGGSLLGSAAGAVASMDAGLAAAVAPAAPGDCPRPHLDDRGREV